MLRKALLRVSIVITMAAGIVGVGAAGAKALPPEFACHHALSSFGVEEVCLLNDPSHDYSQILYFRNAGGASTVEVGQAHDYPFMLTGVDVQWEDLAHLVVLNDGTPAQRALELGLDLHNRDLGGQHAGLNLALVNKHGPDEGVLQTYETFSPRGSSLTFAWTDGACGVFYGRRYVGPCALLVVPKVPLVPYVPLP